jgi:predicted Zn-ribbon and HTH transcriptional regulator
MQARAHTAVYAAVERGQLQRQPCEECGATETHAHHPDYRKPLEVRWLCGTHHRQLHGLELTERVRQEVAQEIRDAVPPTKTISVEFLLCDRCGHEWLTRRPQLPKICPKCKSIYWNTPKPKKASA